MMNENDLDLVSIIMPSFNSMRTIKDSMESVLNQTYENWELLITDDASQDDTVKFISEFSAKEPRVRLFINPNNAGAGASRNNSIAKAKGRYIAFLDSDDLWAKDKLFHQISFMNKNKIALSYSAYQKIDENGSLGKIIIPPSEINYQELLKSNVIGCLMAVYDQSIVGKIYMPTIRKRQDMALWLDILKKVKYAKCVPGVLAYYRESKNSLSSNKFKILFSQWSFYRQYLSLNFWSSIYYFSHYVLRALLKHKT